jgi:hypothetical protein
MRAFPKHEKVPEEVQNPHEKLVDKYPYLNLDLHHLNPDNNENMF